MRQSKRHQKISVKIGVWIWSFKMIQMMAPAVVAVVAVVAASNQIATRLLLL